MQPSVVFARNISLMIQVFFHQTPTPESLIDMKIFSSQFCKLTALLLVLVVLPNSLLAGVPVRETIDGVLHVKNPAKASGGVQTLIMQEQWRVGGEDDEDVLFGLIPRTCSDAAGNVYVLDSQLNQVFVFNPEGEMIRSLFREGEGPGEIREPRDMMVLGNGRVAVVQEFPGMVIFVENDGTPAGRVKIGGTDGGIFSLTGCDAAGDHFIMSGNTQSPGESPGTSNRQYFLSHFDDKGVETQRYCESLGVYDFQAFKFSEREHTPPFWFTFAAGADGRTCVAPDRDQYSIQVFAPDGKLEMIIEREYQPIDRSDQEYDDTRAIYETALTSLPVDYKLIVERQASAVAFLQRGLRIRDDGTIWALSGRGIRNLPTGVLAVFDVFDRKGNFVKQVEIRGPGDPLKDGIFFVGKDRLVVVKGYMESLAAQFGSGTTASGEDDEESSLAVISYKLGS